MRKKFKPVEPFEFLTSQTVPEKKLKKRDLPHA